MSTRIWALSLLGLVVGGLPAAADICTRSLGRWGGLGSTTTVVRAGDQLYFGGAVIRMARLDDPELPVLFSEVDLRGVASDDARVTGIAMDGDSALIGLKRHGCVLVDLANGDSPVVKGAYSVEQTGWEVRGVALMGTMGIVGLSSLNDPHQSRFVQLDLSEPDALSEMDTVDVAGQIQAVAILGRYGVVMASGHPADGGGEPAPAALRSYDLLQWHGIVEAGAVEFEGVEPIAVDIVDERAYVLDYGGGVHLLDLSAPASPELESSFETESFGWGGLEVDGDHLYVVGTNGLFVVDLSAGSVGESLASLELVGLGPGLAAHDGIVYVAKGAEGVAVVDALSSAGARVLTTCGSARHVSRMAFHGQDIVVSDDSVELAGRAQEVLHLLRTDRVGHLEHVARLEPPGPVHGLALADSRLIAAVDPAWDGGVCGLLAWDLGAPMDPPPATSAIDLCAFRVRGRAVMAAGGHVAAVLDDSGAEVHLFDLASAAWAEEAGSWPASIDVSHVSVAPGRLALCRSSSAEVFVDVVDISDAGEPSALGTVALNGVECLSMDCEGNRLVVATRVLGQPWGSYSELSIVDLETAELEGTVDRVSDSQGVSVSLGDGLVHAAEFVGNLAQHRVVDLMDDEPVLTDVRIRGNQDTVLEAFAGTLVWGLGDSGLRVVGFRRCVTPARDYSDGGRAGGGSP